MATFCNLFGLRLCQVSTAISCRTQAEVSHQEGYLSPALHCPADVLPHLGADHKRWLWKVKVIAGQPSDDDDMSALAQAILFKDDKTVSKPMVKYASALSRESVVEVEAIVRKVDTKVEACTQSEVSEASVSAGQASAIIMHAPSSMHLMPGRPRFPCVLWSCWRPSLQRQKEPACMPAPLQQLGLPGRCHASCTGDSKRHLAWCFALISRGYV